MIFLLMLQQLNLGGSLLIGLVHLKAVIVIGFITRNSPVYILPHLALKEVGFGKRILVGGGPAKICGPTFGQAPLKDGYISLENKKEC